MTPQPALTPLTPPEPTPAVWVVTRHPGAAQWVQAQLRTQHPSVQVIPHLHAADIRPGDHYCGVFPLNLAAAICHAGALCWAIALHVPPALRGQELSAAQLDALGAQLVRYVVQEVER